MAVKTASKRKGEKIDTDIGDVFRMNRKTVVITEPNKQAIQNARLLKIDTKKPSEFYQRN